MEIGMQAKALAAGLLLLALPAPRAVSSSPLPVGEVTRLENGDFLLASDLPADQAEALKADLAFLRSLSIRKDPVLQHLLELNDELTPSVLEKWVAERVRYIVSEEMEIRPKVLLWDYAYENPWSEAGSDESSQALGLDTAGAPSAPPAVIMTNTGTGIYQRAKRRHSLAGLEIPGIGMVRVTSPRTGILKVGEGMFRPRFQKKGFTDTSAPIYSIFRLEVLFHEARHSDGNSGSLGFPHTVCPVGHDFEGLFGCDLSLNGAYVVGAHALKVLTASCTDCPMPAREALKLLMLDSFNRVLQKGVQNPVEALKRFQCEKAALGKLDLTTDQEATCDRLSQTPPTTTEASVWDARPEGKREETEL